MSFKCNKIARWSMVLLWGLAWTAAISSCQPEANMRGLQNLDRVYEEQLLRWTQSGRIYHSIDRILFVHSTYLSPAFRQAFGTQYISVFGIDPGKVDSDLEVLATSVGRGHEFFVFADTTDFSWNNLDETDSVWRLALWGGPDQIGVAPISIHRFHGRGPNLKAFFPYLTDFGLSYLVVFPLDQPNGKPVVETAHGILSLKLSSAFGSANMSWKVAE